MRRRRGRAPIVVAGTAVLVVGALAVTALVVVTRHGGHAGTNPSAACDEAHRLHVAAAPQIAPVLAELGRSLGDAAPGCPLVAVSAQPPAETLDRLGAGSRSGSDGRAAPDAWVPESSVWLRAAAVQFPGVFTPDGTPLARSPLVVALPQPLARSLGLPGAELGWAGLADRLQDGRIPRFSLADPLRTTDGMLAVLAVDAAMRRSGADPGIAQMRVLTFRSRLADARADIPGLLHRLAGLDGSDPAVREVGAFALTEQEFWRYGQRRQGTPLVALYPADAVVEADYPLALSASAAADPERRGIAARLLARFGGAGAADTLAAHGFRPAPRRSGPPGRGPGPAGPGPRGSGLRDDYPAPVPLDTEPARVTSVLTAWARYRPLPIQVMVLVDGSGSMNGPVRDRSGRVRTKADLLRESGVQAGRLFGAETSIGMWEFSTHQPGTPYQEVVPFGPIDGRVGGVDRRTAMILGASRFTAFPGSGTPMYETVLRATAAMRDRFRPGVFSAVVVLTDGREEDSQFALTLPQFLSRLSIVEDRSRPVPIFAIGYGADADMSALTAMARATGGQAIASADPADLATAVARIFLAVHTRG